MKPYAAAIIVVLVVGGGSGHGETIVLKSGHRLVGEVLKEGGGTLYVDVGVAVLKISLKDIGRRLKGGATSRPSAGPDSLAGEGDGLYASANLRPTTIRDCVARFGEGVVLVRSPAGMGSGFFISEDGYCVTNCHVIERETRIAVTIFKKQGREFVRRKIDKVRLVALNPFMDLALLKVPAQRDLKFTQLYLGRIGGLKVGDPVFAIGNPMGLERSVSQGIVSTKNRNYGGLTYIQTTAPINPGNSGGPLLNLKGEVVGVANMGYITLDGLGFAIPVSYLKHFLANRDAFAFDKDHPNTGYRYLQPPGRQARTGGSQPVKP